MAKLVFFINYTFFTHFLYFGKLVILVFSSKHTKCFFVKMTFFGLTKVGTLGCKFVFKKYFSSKYLTLTLFGQILLKTLFSWKYLVQPFRVPIQGVSSLLPREYHSRYSLAQDPPPNVEAVVSTICRIVDLTRALTLKGDVRPSP